MSSSSLSRSRLTAAGVLAAVAALVVVPVAAAHDVEARRLRVLDEGGRTVLTASLPPSGRFSLDYQHSYYDQPATEHFVADDAGLRVVALSSPSEAVLDYYDVPGTRRTTARGVHVLVPEATPALDVLPLIATATGRRTLVVEGRRTRLWAADGGARHLELRLAAPSGLRSLLAPAPAAPVRTDRT